jgi:hypothetical protein
VQADAIEPKLKLPGTKRLKLKCDEPLSNLALKFKLRRYTWVPAASRAVCTSTYRLPRHRHAFKTSIIELIGSLLRGEHYCPPRH